MRDSQISKIYSAEQRLSQIYDRVVESGNPVVDLDGITLTLPPEAKFASIESIQRYCDQVTSMMDTYPVRVRERRGEKSAHYECPNVIAVPDVKWALRELVVLHELSHHIAGLHCAHGPVFADTFIELAGQVMGPEAGLALRVLYDHAGAEVG